MSYLVTGATGFVGRHLVDVLLDRADAEVVLVIPPGPHARLDEHLRAWAGRAGDRLSVLRGDADEAALGVDTGWIREHVGEVRHLVHLLPEERGEVDPGRAEAVARGRTRNALELAADLDVGTFHHLSSTAASGDYPGFWDETMFDVDQDLPAAHHRIAFAAEQSVREESAVPWRVYRTSLVVGHSGTGAMEGPDAAPFVLPLLDRLRRLPAWLPLLSVDLGDANLVPVDFVATAVDHLLHLPGRDGEAFHLVDPFPRRTVEVLNVFAAAAGAPRWTVPVDRAVLQALPMQMLPRALRPPRVLGEIVRTRPGRAGWQATLGRLGVPPSAADRLCTATTYGARLTDDALAGSGIAVPDLESYAGRVWAAWSARYGAGAG